MFLFLCVFRDSKIGNNPQQHKQLKMFIEKTEYRQGCDEGDAGQVLAWRMYTGNSELRLAGNEWFEVLKVPFLV